MAIIQRSGSGISLNRFIAYQAAVAALVGPNGSQEIDFSNPLPEQKARQANFK
jgi:hypothetical protein